MRRTYKQYKSRDAKVEGSSNSRRSCSRVAQWKSAGPVTQRSMDRNRFLLYINVIFFYNPLNIFDFSIIQFLVWHIIGHVNHATDLCSRWPSWFVRRTYKQYKRPRDAKVEGSSPSGRSWSRVAQWKRAGPIAQWSMYRNHFLLYSCHMFLRSIEFFFNLRHSIFDFAHNRRLNHAEDICSRGPVG